MKKQVAISMALLMTLSQGSGIINAEKKTTESIKRISGEDRIETSVLVSKETFKNAENVIIASGNVFQDALSGTILASSLNAPILLTNGVNIDEKVLNEIERLGTKNVYILGGINSVSNKIERELNKKYNIERIAGKDRYETSLKIANLLKEKAGYENVALASGNVFADSLSASVALAKKKMPILLVDGKNLPNINKDRIKYIFGGKNTIKFDVPGTVRISGIDRYETAVKVAKEFFGNSSKYVLTSGELFPDALSSSVLAYKNDAPILLTEKEKLNKHIVNNIDLLKKSLIIVGGKDTVSSDSEEKAEKLISPKNKKDEKKDNNSNDKKDENKKTENSEIKNIKAKLENLKKSLENILKEKEKIGDEITKEEAKNINELIDKYNKDRKEFVELVDKLSDKEPEKKSLVEAAKKLKEIPNVKYVESEKYVGVADSIQYPNKKNEVDVIIRNGKIIELNIDKNRYGDDFGAWYESARSILDYIIKYQDINKMISNIDDVDNLLKQIKNIDRKLRADKLEKILEIKLSEKDRNEINSEKLDIHLREKISELYANKNRIDVDTISGATNSKKSILNAVKNAYNKYKLKKEDNDENLFKKIEELIEPKLFYKVGQKLDLTNLKVNLVKNDNTKIEVPFSEFSKYNIKTNLENGKILREGEEELIITHRDTNTNLRYIITTKVDKENILLKKIKIKLEGDKNYKEFDVDNGNNTFIHKVTINETIIGKDIKEFILEDNKNRKMNVIGFKKGANKVELNDVRNINSLDYELHIILDNSSEMNSKNEIYKYKDIIVNIKSKPKYDLSKVYWVQLSKDSKIVKEVYKETPIDYRGLILMLMPESDGDPIAIVPYEKFDEYGISITPVGGYSIGDKYGSRSDFIPSIKVKGASKEFNEDNNPFRKVYLNDSENFYSIKIKNGTFPLN